MLRIQPRLRARIRGQDQLSKLERRPNLHLEHHFEAPAGNSLTGINHVTAAAVLMASAVS